MGRREKPIDPAAGPVARFASELRALRQAAGGPTYRVMAKRAQYSVTVLADAAAGEKLPSLPVALAYVTASEGDPKEWEDRWREAAKDEAALLTAEGEEEAAPPYRGLARFEAGDSDRFFGRDRLTDELEALVRAQRCVMVFGPSGSGKSSLLRAGLIPRLRSTRDPELRPAAIRILTPGPRPAHDHEKLFIPADAPDGTVGETWLVVDQFEEVFTLCTDPEQRARFLQLLSAAQAPESRLRVVLGVRADFVARCLEDSVLAAVIREAGLAVGPMSSAELRAVIVKPAAAEGLIVERALTARLLEEAGQEPGGLPLLSHALLETWRRRRGRTLTLEGYDAAGGIHGAIAQSAEDLYNQLSSPQAAAARRILLRLITPGEGTPDTRRPVERAELDTGDRTGTAQILERLARARLITLDDSTADLAHEALITAWPRLRRWIEQTRERLRVHRKLTEAATAWAGLDRDSGALYRGTQLATANEHFPDSHHLTSLERAFLAASITAREQEQRVAARTTRRLRRFTVALSVLLVLVLTAGLVAWVQSRSSEHQRQVAVSRQFAAAATFTMDGNPAQASLFAIEAYRTAPTAEAATSLYEAAALPRRHRLTGHNSAVTTAAFSPDGRTLATGSDKTVRLWDTATGKSRAVRIGGGGWDIAVAFGPRGHVLAGSPTHRLARTTLLRDVTAKTSHRLGHGDIVNTVAFSPDGRTLVTGSSEDATVRLWDTATGKHRTAFTSSDMGAAISRSGRTLATVGAAHAVRVRDIATGRTRATFSGHTDDVDGMAFSPDERTLATVSSDSTVRLWNVATGTSRTLTGHTDGVYEVAFSPDGKTLATGGEDTTVRLWDTATGKHRATLAGHSGVIETIAFSPDGHTLATGSGDRTVRLWDMRVTSPAAAMRSICRAVRKSQDYREGRLEAAQLCSLED